MIEARNSGCAAFVAAVVVMLVFFSMCDGGSDTQTSRTDQLGRDAFLTCRRLVRDRLRAPSTAKFPHSGATGVVIAGAGTNRWRIDAYVDAQNAFGAMLRTHFTCDMEYVGNNEWQPHRVHLHE